jgi:hypothetical protein
VAAQPVLLGGDVKPCAGRRGGRQVVDRDVVEVADGGGQGGGDAGAGVVGVGDEDEDARGHG